MMDRSQAAPVHDASPPSLGEAAGSVDAKGLQQALREELLADEKHPRQPAARVEPTGPPRGRLLLRRSLKIAAGLAVIAIFGWLPLRAMWQNSSVEAVLNSRLVTLRAPIGGRVAAAPAAIKDQAHLDAGMVVLRVVNSRGDRTRLDDLRRQKSRLENERPESRNQARDRPSRPAGPRPAGRIVQGRTRPSARGAHRRDPDLDRGSRRATRRSQRRSRSSVLAREIRQRIDGRVVRG